MTEPKNKGGRPPKPEAERRQQIGVRVAPPLKAKIEEAAEANGRSVAQEIELRLSQSFERESIEGHADTTRLLNMIAAEISLIESVTRKRWSKDLTTWAAVAESLVQGPILRVRPDRTDDDEIVNAAWQDISAARQKKAPLVMFLKEHGLAIELEAPILRNRLKKPRGMFRGLLWDQIYPDDRRNEREQVQKLPNLSDDQREGLLSTLDAIERFDAEEVEAEKRFGEALQPFHDAEQTGRNWYRQDRSRRALADAARGEPINWSEVAVWPSASQN